MIGADQIETAAQGEPFGGNRAPGVEHFLRHMATTYSPGQVAAYYAARVSRVRQHGNEWRGPCPLHNGQGDNFAVKGETGEWYCHSQCQRGGSMVDLEMSLSGDDFKHAAAEVDRIVGRQPAANRRVVKTYDYEDDHGEVLFQVVRYEPKEFRQRKPDGRGGWIWKTKGVRRVLYRHSKLKDAETVIVVEGEKDVESLEKLGFVATCNPGGAGKWRQEYSEILAGKHVIIFPDNDPPGKEHAHQVLGTLIGKVPEIRLAVVGKGKDVTEWIGVGATREIIEAAISAAPVMTASGAGTGPAEPRSYPESESSETESLLPDIIVNNRQLRELSRECIDALVRKNNPPHLFVRGGRLVDLRHLDSSRTVITDLTDVHVRGLMARTASFFVMTESGRNNAPPPLYVAKDILSIRDLVDKFPVLEGITEVPVLRADGTILTQPGYDPISKLYYSPATDLVIPSIPVYPTSDDVRRALAVIDSAMADFPFVYDVGVDGRYVLPKNRDYAEVVFSASKANALATMLNQLVRTALDGPTPLSIVDAPAAGTGKTLFAEIVSLIATGRAATLFSAPRDEDEARKQITSYLREGVGVIVIDNVRDRLESAQLAKALTAVTWADRILGQSQTVVLPVRCTWICTGNNVAVAGDLPRRCYWIRMDARTPSPHLRSGFRHQNLRRWVTKNRGHLVAALLTLARSWFASGKPPGIAPILGSFEAWSTTMSGILDHAGVRGFCANSVEFVERTDADTVDDGQLLVAIYDVLGRKRFTSADVEALCRHDQSSGKFRKVLSPELAEALTQDGLFARRIGKWFSDRSDRRFGESQIHVTRAGTTHNVQMWKVVNPSVVADEEVVQ